MFLEILKEIYNKLLIRIMTIMNKNSYNLCVAPMMGHTDAHFRYFLRLISKHAMLYTEMVASNSIVDNKSKKYDKLTHEQDNPEYNLVVMTQKNFQNVQKSLNLMATMKLI